MHAIAMDNQPVPLPTTSLVGRDDELARLLGLLGRPDARLITLAGPGGVGKTRLALQAIHDIDEHVTGPARLVLLANVTDGADVLPAITRALGIPTPGNASLDDELASGIGDRAMLLVLDNVEQVSDHLTFLANLIARCPRLTILVTSRVMLHLSGEHVFTLDPLPTASPGLDQLAPATALFVDRARLVKPDLQLTDENIRAIDDICRRVDGLPLAIELAAARTRFLSPTAMRDRLGERLPMLVGGPRDAPERHRTIRATLEWSHDLLDDDERRLFRRLAVAINGIPYDAVEPIANFNGDLDVRVDALLAELIDHSLARVEDSPETGPRVRLLHTVREFAMEQLEQSGEMDAALRAHARWYADLVISTPATTWRTGSAEIRAWTRRHFADLPTFYAVLDHLLQAGEGATAVRMAAQLTSFWLEMGQLHEAHAWIERCRPYVDQVPTADQARFYRMAGIAYLNVDRVDPARDLLQRSLELGRDLDDPLSIANGYNLLGMLEWLHGDPAEGERLQRAAISTMREAGDELGAAMFIGQLGERLVEDGQPERAAPLFEEALPVISRDREDALPLLYGSIGYMHLRTRDLERAGADLRRSLRYHQAPPHQRPDMLSMVLMLAAELAGHKGLAGDGARLLGASLRLVDDIGFKLNRKSQDDVDLAESVIRAGIDADHFDQAFVEGRQMGIPAAIDLAIAVCAAPATTPGQPAGQPADAPDDDLTPREREVLILLAAGKSNSEIADELFISQRTVTTHLTRLYAKLEVGSRTAAISAALRLGIVPRS
jgi:predicted ATPase/DNA-binding CsgD family transcriptional regulator